MIILYDLNDARHRHMTVSKRLSTLVEVGRVCQRWMVASYFPSKNLLKYHNLLSNAQFVSVMFNVKWVHFLSYSLETFGIFYFCNSVTKTGLGLQLCRLTLPVTRQDFPGSSLKAIFIQFYLNYLSYYHPIHFFPL